MTKNKACTAQPKLRPFKNVPESEFLALCKSCADRNPRKCSFFHKLLERCFGMSEYDCIRRCQRVVIANKASRFGGVIRQKIVGPTKADWLVPELYFNSKRAL